MKPFDYHRPRTVDEAWRIWESEPGARFIAGGTDIMVGIRSGTVRPAALVSLRNIPTLAGVECDGETRIGAGTTIRDLIAHPALRGRFPVLVEACRRLGSAQVRNVATIGGNLCNASPCADTAPPLLVLDARVRLERPGKSRELALHEFFEGPDRTRMAPGEILTRIILPPPAPGSRGAFFKMGRVGMDLAKTSVAVQIEMDGAVCLAARIAAGSVAPIPLRLRDAEARLAGSPITDDTAAEVAELAMKAVSPITDLRSSAEYRRRIVGVLVRRALDSLANPGGG